MLLNLSPFKLCDSFWEFLFIFSSLRIFSKIISKKIKIVETIFETFSLIAKEMILDRVKLTYWTTTEIMEVGWV